MNAGGARLEKKISCAVFEKTPSIVYKKEIGVLRAGNSFEIPAAQAVFVRNEFGKTHLRFSDGQEIDCPEGEIFSLRVTGMLELLSK